MLSKIIDLSYLGVSLIYLIRSHSFCYDLFIHQNIISYFWLEILHEMIVWSFKNSCINNARDGTGDLFFEEYCDCDDVELDFFDVHIGVPMKESDFNKFFWKFWWWFGWSITIDRFFIVKQYSFKILSIEICNWFLSYIYISSIFILLILEYQFLKFS